MPCCILDLNELRSRITTTTVKVASMFKFGPEELGQGMQRIDVGEGGIRDALFFPDANNILVLSDDRSAFVYDAASGERRYRLPAADVIRTCLSSRADPHARPGNNQTALDQTSDTTIRQMLIDAG